MPAEKWESWTTPYKPTRFPGSPLAILARNSVLDLHRRYPRKV